MLLELLECLGGVADPRAPTKVEHRLVDVLAIAVCAVLAHAESFEDIALYGRSKRAWLGRFLELPGGIPSHDPFRRVLMLIDPGEFEQGFLAWTRRAFVVAGDEDREDDGAPPQIAVDGKAPPILRGGAGRRCVSAFATRPGPGAAPRCRQGRRAPGLTHESIRRTRPVHEGVAQGHLALPLRLRRERSARRVEGDPRSTARLAAALRSRTREASPLVSSPVEAVLDGPVGLYGGDVLLGRGRAGQVVPHLAARRCAGCGVLEALGLHGDDAAQARPGGGELGRPQQCARTGARAGRDAHPCCPRRRATRRRSRGDVLRTRPLRAACRGAVAPRSGAARDDRSRLGWQEAAAGRPQQVGAAGSPPFSATRRCASTRPLAGRRR